MAWHSVKRPSSRRWERLRLRILERDGYRCCKCGRASRLEVDHVVRMHAGGHMWDPKNLQALCRGCHIRKTADENSRVPECRDRIDLREYVRATI